METNNLLLVCITGITTFVGCQICLAFLQNGGFKVRGTMNDIKNRKMLKQLNKAYGSMYENLEIVQRTFIWKVHCIRHSKDVSMLSIPRHLLLKMLEMLKGILLNLLSMELPMS